MATKGTKTGTGKASGTKRNDKMTGSITGHFVDVSKIEFVNRPTTAKKSKKK